MTTVNFDVKWPVGEPPGRDSVNFGRIPNTKLIAFDCGVAIQFAPPFSDLLIYSGERLTPAKAARLREAAGYYGACIEETT
jgi:hypothetical protein